MTRTTRLDGPERALSLPELCNEAADHVARARLSLNDGSHDAALALAHLDDAIACLKRLSAEGRSAPQTTVNPPARSA